jgi:uncharacterized protein (TIGR02466 family)
LQVFDLFPTALGIFNLGRDFNKEELNFIKNLETHLNTGNLTSNNHDVLNSVELEDISTFINASVKEYFEKINAPKNEVSLRVTQSWCNYTEKGQYHHRHAHPNSFISGVLYVQATKDKDKIYFYSDKYRHLVTPTNNWNIYNSESWWMEAVTGKLFIFPSTLVHMVEPVEADDTRISLSFNTFPVGNFGDDTTLTGLRL